MSRVTIDLKFEGRREVIAALKQAEREGREGISRALYRVGTLVKDRAVEYAPKSPTSEELRAFRRKSGRGKRKSAGNRKARATSRTKPGGLMRSISYKSNAKMAEVFVATNSEAGRYAWRIHEEKGRTWHKVGPGTLAKGAKADHKFIERAIKDSAKDIELIFRRQLMRSSV